MLIYGTATILIALFLIGPIRRRNLRKLTRLAPGSVAFTVENRRQFTDPLSLVGVGTELGERAPSLTSSPGVTADAFGLSFWDHTPFSYVGTIDWDRVCDIRVSTQRSTLPRFGTTAILLDVLVEGATIQLPLLSPNGTNGMFASRRESEYLATQLKQLRAAAA
jgi:hypothetical protein